MHTANHELRDALIRHQVGVQRMASTVRSRVVRALDATEADLRDQIERLTRGPSGEEAIVRPATVARLRRLEASVRVIRGGAVDEALRAWREDLGSMAEAEPRFAAAAVTASSPVLLDLELPSANLLRALVTTRPFEGRTLGAWAESLRRADLQRIMDQVRIGMIEGEGPQALARRVVGTARLRGTDGVTEVTRRQAEAITRTASNAFTNAAKGIFYRQNSDVIEAEVWLSTLDGRTCPECMGLDGERFPVGEGRRPPAHVGCRCVRVAVLAAGVLGDRPMKPVTERMLLREFARDRGIAAPATRAGLPRGLRGAFDGFSRGRVRELTGTTVGRTTYSQFLRRQSAEFQDDVLGRTRGALFRRGDLELSRFTNRAGDQLSLSELARRERSAFEAANLDPEDFI